MKLTDKEGMSKWIWDELIKGNKDEDLKKMAREYIMCFKGSREAYLYCILVEDDPEVRKYIKESYWAYMYCTNIEDKEEMWKRITDPNDAFYYTMEVTKRPKLLKLAKRSTMSMNMFGQSDMSRMLEDKEKSKEILLGRK